MSQAKRIVICGGGAIGTAIAYFASRRGARPILIERHAVGGSASGKSGGFLALDWCRGRALDQLARRSFQLHADLAEELGNPWSYQRVTTYAGHADAADDSGGAGQRPWLSGKVALTGRLGSPQTTAVVEPHGFTNGLMRAAEARDAELRHGAAVDLMRRADGSAGGVVLDSGEVVEGDAVVVAMGPWSILATRWLPMPAVYGYKGHSLIYETGKDIPLEALFLEYREACGEVLSPELFVRATARHGCARSRRRSHCRSIPRRFRPMTARMRGWRPCARTCHPCSPPRRSRRDRHASGRSPTMACR